MFRTITQESNNTLAGHYDGQGHRHMDKQEIGGKAVWSLSSAKPGFGVEQLRDDNIDSYWQSDGPQPHTINIHFSKKSSIEELSIYANYALDESYTPSLVSIKAGTTNHDLQEIKLLPIKEPTGWIHIPLVGPNNEPLRTHFLQLAILSNHQNGRDTHLRQIKIYGPRLPVSSLISAPQFNTVEASAYSFLR
eukprot:Phypoly_transcript_16406.p1 GENE.Phypoly_transcript_16406~~Phypoly_transcript_16406.p1  ORF type:complete len:192 (+),score=18.04 Phypoly_transcript_16406:189-764(+)